LHHIQDTLGTQDYARLRFGIGNDFAPGRQIDYVLSAFTSEELEKMPPLVSQAAEIVKSFCLSGVDFTMNQFN
jgi:PTH1 family peptidyl-tRNA hydrolase